MYLAFLFFNRQNYQKAINILGRIIARDPEFADAYQYRGFSWDAINQHDNALADYNRALELKPDEPLILCRRGGLLREKGCFQKALADFNQAIKLNEHLIIAYYERAYLWMLLEEYDKAILDASYAIQKEPTMIFAFIVRSNCWLMKDNQKKAEEDSNRAMSLDPQLISVLYNRALTRVNRGDSDGAIDDYTTCLRLEPENIYCLLGRSTAYSEKGKLQLALADSKKIVDLAPDNAHGCHNLGMTLFALECYKESVEWFERAYRLDQNNPEILFSLTWTLATCPDESFRNGRLALEYAQKLNALSSTGNTPVWKKLVALAAASAECGKYTNAVSYQLEALQMMPEPNKERAELALAAYQAGRTYNLSPRICLHFENL